MKMTSHVLVRGAVTAPHEHRQGCRAHRLPFRTPRAVAVCRLACSALLLVSVQWLGVWSVLTASSSAEQNWPQWRGPLGTGVAPTANPPVTWSETSNIKWKVKIPGSGSATPIIWGDQVFIKQRFPQAKRLNHRPPRSPSRRRRQPRRRREIRPDVAAVALAVEKSRPKSTSL